MRIYKTYFSYNPDCYHSHQKVTCCCHSVTSVFWGNILNTSKVRLSYSTSTSEPLQIFINRVALEERTSKGLKWKSRSGWPWSWWQFYPSKCFHFIHWKYLLRRRCLPENAPNCHLYIVPLFVRGIYTTSPRIILLPTCRFPSEANVGYTVKMEEMSCHFRPKIRVAQYLLCKWPAEEVWCKGVGRVRTSTVPSFWGIYIHLPGSFRDFCSPTVRNRHSKSIIYVSYRQKKSSVFHFIIMFD